MGFIRQPMRAALDREGIAAAVTRSIAAEEIARLERAADPFGVDDPCPNNQGPHQPIALCGEIICPNCGKVFWQ